MEKKKILFPMGIVIGAFGHPMYAHYAYNYAVGAKYNSPELPISIVVESHSLNMLEPEQKEIFDNIIIAKPEWINGVHGKDYMKFKLHLNEISPYQKTLYTDVDMQWCPGKSPFQLMEYLNGSSFEIANRGYKECKDAAPSVYDWLHLNEIYSVYGIEKACDVSSEVIYFEQGEVADKIFSESQRVYNENKLNVRPFSHAKPDEPYLMVGIALSGHEPIHFPYEPSFWQGKYFLDLKPESYVYNYFLISGGGDVNHPNTIRIYNNLTGMYFNASGLDVRTAYRLQSKQNILTERRKQTSIA